MIDKELIKKAVDKKSCFGLQECVNCPVDRTDSNYDCMTDFDSCEVNERAIRIMQEWLDSQVEK
jgi:hypothetical protein